MKINYYNSVNVESSKEHSISLSRKLDEMGTKLTKPYQAAYGGHSYRVNVSAKEVSKTEEPSSIQRQDLSIGVKIKVSIGIALKKVAAFFSKEVKAKYTLVGLTAEKKDSAFETLKSVRKTPKKEGDDADCLTALCCCCLIGAAAGAAVSATDPHHGRHRHGRHHAPRPAVVIVNSGPRRHGHCHR